MVSLPSARAVGVLLTVLVAGPLSAQGSPGSAPPPRSGPEATVSVGVRPTRARVGEVVVLTVRVEGPDWPTSLEFDPGPGAELLGSSDRTSTRVGEAGRHLHRLERDIELRILREGPLDLPPVRVTVGARVLEGSVPRVVAGAAGLEWGPRDGGRSASGRVAAGPGRAGRSQERSVRGEGEPPPVEGTTFEATSAPWVPYRPGPWPGVPYAPGTTLATPDGMPYLGWGASAGSTVGIPWGPPWGMGWEVPWGPAGSGYAPWGGIPPGPPPPYASLPGGGRGSGAWSEQDPGLDPEISLSPTLALPHGIGRGVAPWDRSRGRPETLGPGEGWAETATEDPWWGEVVPEILRYDQVATDDAGLATLEAGLVPESPFVGEQVTVVATASFPPEAVYRMTGDPRFRPSSAEGAWVVELPWGPGDRVAAGGRAVESHSFLRAYFPIRPGELRIAPATLEYAAQAGGAVGGNVSGSVQTLTVGPFSVPVRAIPTEGAPEGWSGSVGRYRLRASLAPERVALGGSSLLVIDLVGVGHLPSQPRPDPGVIWGGGARPLGEQSWVEVRDGVVGGVKRFTWLVVPGEPGTIRIGPAVHSYFDPYLEAFDQAVGEELVLEVDEEGGAALEPWMDLDPTDRAGAWPGHGLPGGADSLSPDGSEGGSGGGRGVASREAPHSRGPVLGSAPTEGAGSPGPPLERPEAVATALRSELAARPGDAEGWRALGRTYAAARPGSGWAEWAWLAGAREVPRDRRLRALATEAFGSSEAPPRLPPLTLAEGLWGGIVLLVGAVTTVLASHAGSWRTPAGLRGVRHGPVPEASPGTVRRGHRGGAFRRVAPLGLLLGGLIFLASAAFASIPLGVVVDGEGLVRAHPTVSSEVVTTLPPGAWIRVGPRHGGWVWVEGRSARGPGGEAAGASIRGWLDLSRLAPLPVRWDRGPLASIPSDPGAPFEQGLGEQGLRGRGLRRLGLDGQESEDRKLDDEAFSGATDRPSA